MEALTGEQLRAARAMVQWRAIELAERAGVGLSTVQRGKGQNGPVTMMRANMNAMISKPPASSSSPKWWRSWSENAEDGGTMPDESGKLITDDIPVINNFIRSVSRDNCLTCPVTGSRVDISKWQISDRLCMMPVSGAHLQADPGRMSPMLSCRSPAGGMVFLDAIYIGLVKPAVPH